MARKKNPNQDNAEVAPGEQLELIDVGPENLKAIKPIARKYRAAMQLRVDALAEEVDAKQKILAMVKQAKLSRLMDGSIRFKCDGMLITVTPRDELVKVKEEHEDESSGED